MIKMKIFSFTYYTKQQNGVFCYNVDVCDWCASQANIFVSMFFNKNDCVFWCTVFLSNVFLFSVSFSCGNSIVGYCCFSCERLGNLHKQTIISMLSTSIIDDDYNGLTTKLNSQWYERHTIYTHDLISISNTQIITPILCYFST